MKKLSKFLLILIYSFFLTCSLAKADAGEFTIPSMRLSYFQLDKDGKIALKNGAPYESNNEKYIFHTTFSPSNTAFIVIDPWVDVASDFLNKHFGKIMNKFLVPLAIKASENFQVYIFTNNCKKFIPPRNCKIPQRLKDLSCQSANVHLIYWDEYNSDEFVESLRSLGISRLIYTGFSSSMCIIERPSGIIQMGKKGFKIYFIPQASAAIETKKTWKTAEMHHYMTLIISQWMAEIIDYKDIYEALGKFSMSSRDD